jgi:hypothetical protein
MENQLQTQDKQVLVVKESTPYLIHAMETGNRLMVGQILNNFKEKNGVIKYVDLAAIPLTDRLPTLAAQDLKRAVALITVGITMALENINVKSGLTDLQIINLAEEIINTCGEDDLSVQDVMMFLQGLVRGKYGKLYESLDVPKFMQFFEEYRQERFQAVIEWKENKHAEFKNLGDPERMGIKKTAFDEALANYSNKLRAKNDEIKELREERKRNRK